MLDVVAEDPQEEHVAAQVEQAAVHEDAGEQGEPDRVWTGLLRDLDGSAADGDLRRFDQVDPVRDLERDGAVAVGEVLATWSPGALEKQEDGDVDGDDGQAHDRRAVAALVLVGDRQHRPDDSARRAP